MTAADHVIGLTVDEARALHRMAVRAGPVDLDEMTVLADLGRHLAVARATRPPREQP